MSTIIGVDLGIRKIAYATLVDGDLRSVDAFAIDNPNRTEQLYHIGLQLPYHLEGLGDDGIDALVVIEKPIIGNNRKYSMQIAETFGAVLAWLGPYARVSSAISVDNTTWKRELIGKGNAKKDDIRNYINVVHTSYSAHCGHDQDKYDALCVGLYGVLLTARADDFLSSVEDAR